MLDAKEEYEKVRVRDSKEMERLLVHERKVELWVHVIALMIVISATQFLYPALSIPVVVAWVGISINSKLIAIYYIVKQVGIVHTTYHEELKNIGREMLADKSKNAEEEEI